MFGFGRDLRRLFDQARKSDNAWVELIGADLLETEARGQTTDSHRANRRDPFHDCLKAATLWREHARRTGRRNSLARALEAATEAAHGADTPVLRAEAALETALCLMLQFEQRGGPHLLNQIDLVLDGHEPGRKGPLTARMAGAHAKLEALRARHSGEAGAMMDASALLDSALHDLTRREELTVETAEAQLDRASLALEAGLKRGDARLLDQAGRDLRALVEAASPEYRPVTRALRNSTPDLDRMLEIEAVTAGEGLILGALARERRLALEAAQAERETDAAQLARMETRLRRRLAHGNAENAPLDWAADQIGLSHVRLARARVTGQEDVSHLGLILTEAAETARELGAGLIVDRARELLASLKQASPSRPA